MTPPLRLVPAADDFLTDRLDPLEQTVEIPLVRDLPPVPAPRRTRSAARSELTLCVLLFAAVLGALAAAIAFGAPQLLTLVNR